MLVFALILMLAFWRRKQKKEENLRFSSETMALNKIETEDWELPLVDLKRIVKATDNFSQDNKIGEGGFGPVYKGKMNDGKEIAVKRLSKNSGQGVDEFRNEVSCIAKLQHRNLVTLLGCCTEKGERILIYEYMTNKSLDSFIFDQSRNLLDWPKRHHIINGIARGLLYLHQDSKLRIIHRDLKASNILLDHEMNPKISDFGMARRFEGSQTEGNTARIVGTYGYISPEYAIDGVFSVKSDVYSFGVLLTEIVSGKKNRLFSHPNHSLNLIGNAWKCYNEDALSGLVDEAILDSKNQMEVVRVIQTGLLCVQEDPIDRPVMSHVVLMLSSTMKLPHPKKPGFFMERKLRDADCLLSNSNFSSAIDTIRANQTISDGETITSAGGEFQLGFFSPGRSTNRYLGIWFKKISNGTVVWVANRDTPISNATGVVRVNEKGITLHTDDGIMWSTNTSVSLENPVVRLLDSGNLVVWDEDSNFKKAEKIIWQSFDYPGDTFLPDMKIGIDLVTGLNSYYTAWKSVDDPSTGIFSGGIDINGFPQFFRSKGSVKWTRCGPWNGLQFSGSPKTNSNGMLTENFVFNEKEICYRLYPIKRTSTDIRLKLTPNGEIRHLVWNYQNKGWMTFINEIAGDCDLYGLCGAYGICHINSSPRCGCLRGFVPKFPERWKSLDWSGGCVRETALNCTVEAGFLKYSGTKLPDTRQSWYDMRINLEECERLCLKNCSCTAYANADIRSGGSGCILWFNDLTDMVSNTADGQNIHIKMPASELVDSSKSRAKRHLRILLVVLVVLVVVALALLWLLVSRKRKPKGEGNLKFNPEGVALNKIESEDWELPSVDFKTLVKATNNFSQDNKLGQGGFGPVYKGTLNDGYEIAVKRLSKNSRQGLDEFINEVSCIAKLQHRNLVSLLGCCTEKGERILIYEYMANKSLDSFIFDDQIRNSMDWLERYKIIIGIARGLLYLHQDSRLRIIHRDLKASNILLDHDMNPKISDFGMARCFKGSQIEANTSRIVGTYGYMSPEYAIDGQFSIKSDVYSFGVLLIEIVSGKKNRLFYHPDHSLNLLGHVWKSYNEDRLVGLIDEVILESSNQIEVFRVIQIGLLCVQEDPTDRPLMSQGFDVEQ
nr:PREDICTED: G-type lectin S-receptor-like serine/threonine-protein kinase At4g27290 [Daucus carota subsp. sativus]